MRRSHKLHMAQQSTRDRKWQLALQECSSGRQQPQAAAAGSSKAEDTLLAGDLKIYFTTFVLLYKRYKSTKAENKFLGKQPHKRQRWQQQQQAGRHAGAGVEDLFLLLCTFVQKCTNVQK